MTQHQKNISEFTRLAGQLTPEIPTEPDFDVKRLRLRLIAEELVELAVAFGIQFSISLYGEIEIGSGCYRPFSDVETYDALLDLDYVVTGCASTCGLDMEPGQTEVHRSNMTKFIDGHRREDGKWIKGPSYSPVNLQPIIDAQSQ